jgi:hypothetical protein
MAERLTHIISTALVGFVSGQFLRRARMTASWTSMCSPSC